MVEATAFGMKIAVTADGRGVVVQAGGVLRARPRG